MNIEILQADYTNVEHAKDILYLLNSYAKDPMGGGEELSQYAKENLVSSLKQIPHAITILAYVNSKPAGLINAFEAFSTFKSKPLLNIHDLAVLQEYRGKGLSQEMLQKIEEIAIAKGCCKLTLEVLSKNKPAKSSYIKFGFKNYELNPSTGIAEFMEKEI
ncbi:MAG TPA: GNAT family N-acetyltransferase [Nitratifractor sp.]|nr:GNAT family N-acetyltransferase [Nitratifractor sp.]